MKQRLILILSAAAILFGTVCLTAWMSVSDSMETRLLPGAGTRDKAHAPCEKIGEPPVTPYEVYEILAAGAPSFMDYSFVEWLGETAGGDVYRKIFNKAPGTDLSDSMFWYTVCGMTPMVLEEIYTRKAEPSGTAGAPVTIAVAGDVCLADDWENMAVYYRKGEVLNECIDTRLLALMNDADLTLVNNEFTFSDRGEPLEGKYYTFRSSTENVSLLTEMGVNIVSLANNHVYDYGAAAFSDTLETLEGAGITYVGAGRNITQASEPRYFIVNGIKIAFVAATRAEKMLLTPQATEHAGGVLRTYKPDRFLAVIAEARANADFVIAYPHWGTENTHVLERAQTEQARQYIDAGADAVVGSHTHCLQGIEHYRGRPIVYSLGNFWFNHEDGDTALLEIRVDGNGVSLTLVPCLQKGGVTSAADGADKQRILSHVESISEGIVIDESGRIAQSSG